MGGGCGPDPWLPAHGNPRYASAGRSPPTSSTKCGLALFIAIVSSVVRRSYGEYLVGRQRSRADTHPDRRRCRPVLAASLWRVPAHPRSTFGGGALILGCMRRSLVAVPRGEEPPELAGHPKAVMSRCGLCGGPVAAPARFCVYHLSLPADDWATGNRMMCDFLHRGIVRWGGAGEPTARTSSSSFSTSRSGEFPA